MPIGPARMPLFDHLGELRRRLTIVVVSVFAAAIVLYFARGARHPGRPHPLLCAGR